MKKTEFQKVKELLYRRIKESIDAGMTMEPGLWATEGAEGTRCAVGAIAFNGSRLRTEPDTDRTYALAAKQLRSIGVCNEDIGAILDAISAGFEDEAIDEVTRHFRKFNYNGESYFRLPTRFYKYYRLGQAVRRKFVDENELQIRRITALRNCDCGYCRNSDDA